MDTHCLLELPIGEGSEILNGVNLKTTIQSTESTENDVNSMLLDSAVESHGGTTFNTTGIDFEFVNSELGPGSAYTMDHSSVFDISEPVIDEKSELFRDSGVFDDCIVKQSEIEKQQNLNLDLPSGRKLIMDLGLKLQIIPLNNLKYVSTIQTSEGVHIVALPDNSSISQRTVQDQPMIRDIFPQLTNNNDVSGTRINDAKDGIHFNKSLAKKVDGLKLIQLRNESSAILNSIPQVGSDLKQGDGSSKFSCVHTLDSLTQNSVTPSFRHLLRKPNPCTEEKGVLPINLNHNNQLNEQVQKIMGHVKHNEALKKSEKDVMNGKYSGRTDFKESKIIIDLRKLMPQRKPRRMVSLLNSPKTNKLYMNNRIATNIKAKPLIGGSLPGNHHKDKSKGRRKSENRDNRMSLKKSTFLQARTLPNKEQNIEDIKTASKGKDIRTVYRNDVKEKPGHEVKKLVKPIKRNDRRYQCSICKAKFIRLGNYQKHLLIHKGNKNENNSQVARNETQVIKQSAYRDSYKGEDVNVNANCLENGTGIQEHLTENEKETFKNSKEGEDTFLGDNIHTVKELAHETELSSELKESIKELDKTKKEGKESNFKVPEDKVEEGNPKEICILNAESTKSIPEVQCCICQLTFSSEGNLTRHMLTHMNEGQRYACPQCQKGFHQLCDLKRHESIHEGQLPHICKLCNKGFLRKSDLIGHEQFHTKQKAYKCDLCSKAYFQSGDLLRHKRLSHKDSCPFACLYCPSKFTAQRSLFTHVRNKHRLQSRP